MKYKVIIYLVFILIFSCFIRILSFSGYYGADDSGYVECARLVAKGDFNIESCYGPPVIPLRIGLFVPVAMIFKIAGISETTMILYPFILSMGSIILAFIAGRVFFGWRAGLISASMQAIIPIDVRSASMLLPDIPASFWANLGIVLIIYGLARESFKLKIVFGVLAGLVFCFSWFCKEITVYLLPFIGIGACWFIYRGKKNIILFASLALIVIIALLIESLIYYKYTLDFMYRFNEIERNYQIYKAYFFDKGSPHGWIEGEYLYSLLKRLFQEGPRALFINQNLGFITLVAIPAICYAALKKIRVFLFPGLWFFTLVFMYNFSSSSLLSYKPLVLYDRYMYLLILPSIVITSGFADRFLTPCIDIRKKINTARLFLGIALISGIGILCAFTILKDIKIGPQSPVERKISHLLRPANPIFTDIRTLKVLNFFWKYPAELHTYSFENMDAEDIPKGAYVLINPERADFVNSRGYMLPKFYRSIPDNWILEWQGYNAKLYRVPAL